MLNDPLCMSSPLLKHKKQVIFFSPERTKPDFYYKKHILDANKFLFNPISTPLGSVVNSD